MRQRLLFPVLFFGLAAFAWGETIINEAAPQPDAPVRILATFATAEDLGGQVDFKNFSNRAVKQIQVAWVIEVPTSCGSSVVPWVITSPIDMLLLKPGETRSAFSYRINADELRRFAMKAKAAALHIQVGVVRVEYVATSKMDAPVWTFDLEQNGSSFDNHQQNSAAPCPDSHDAKQVASELLHDPAEESGVKPPPCLKLWTCVGTSNYTYCFRVYHGKACSQDALGYCCFNYTCTPETCPPYCTCHIACEPGKDGESTTLVKPKLQSHPN